MNFITLYNQVIFLPIGHEDGAVGGDDHVCGFTEATGVVVVLCWFKGLAQTQCRLFQLSRCEFENLQRIF